MKTVLVHAIQINIRQLSITVKIKRTIPVTPVSEFLPPK